MDSDTEDEIGLLNSSDSDVADNGPNQNVCDKKIKGIKPKGGELKPQMAKPIHILLGQVA